MLVLRALGVGDLATGVPALRGLRRAYPQHRLVLAAPAWLAPLARLTGAVDELLPHDGLEPLPEPSTVDWAGPPAVAVNLHGRGPQSHRILGTTGAGRLLAFGNEEAGFPYGPQWIDDEHEVIRWCRMLAYFGIAADPEDLDLLVPDEPAGGPATVRGATLVHPGAKSPVRRWPADRFAAVARALADAGHHVLVTGGPDERDLAGAVAAGAGLPPEHVVAGSTGIGELAALVALARLVVSGDTGIAHLATGYRTPSVVLFGPMPPRRWGPPPYRPWHRAIWHGERVSPGDAPGPDPDPALLKITVEEVLAAVEPAGSGH
jgi:ADP-heptose:LPS heptosyltransferase